MTTIDITDAILSKSIELLQFGDYQGAFDELVRISQKTSPHPILNLLLAKASLGRSDIVSTANSLIAAYSLAPDDLVCIQEIIKIALQARLHGLAIKLLQEYNKKNPENISVAKQLIDLQSSYIQDLESHIETKVVDSSALKNVHAIIKTYLQGKKINIDTLQWEIMGGLATDASMLPRIKATGFLNDKNPVFLCGNPANPPIVKLIARQVPVVEIPSLGSYQFLAFKHATSEYYLIEDAIKEKLFGALHKNTFDDCFEFYHSNNGRAYISQDKLPEIEACSPQISFDQSELEYAERFLKESMNMPKDARWICVYARDPGYYGETSQDGKYFRNAPLATFYPTITKMIDQGYYVIRVGSATKIPLDFHHPMVIDYSYKFQDQLMDLFLIAKSELLIGSPSGLTHVAFIFNTISLNVHTINFFPSWGSLYIPKKPCDVSSGQLMKLKDYFRRTYYNPDFFTVWEDGVKQQNEFGIVYQDNSEEEILEAYQELTLRKLGSYIESPEEKRLKEIFTGMISGLPGPFPILTPISTRFLLRNRYLFD